MAERSTPESRRRAAYKQMQSSMEEDERKRNIPQPEPMVIPRSIQRGERSTQTYRSGTKGEQAAAMLGAVDIITAPLGAGQLAKLGVKGIAHGFKALTKKKAIEKVLPRNIKGVRTPKSPSQQGLTPAQRKAKKLAAEQRQMDRPHFGGKPLTKARQDAYASQTPPTPAWKAYDASGNFRRTVPAKPARLPATSGAGSSNFGKVGFKKVAGNVGRQQRSDYKAAQGIFNRAQQGGTLRRLPQFLKAKNMNPGVIKELQRRMNPFGL